MSTERSLSIRREVAALRRRLESLGGSEVEIVAVAKGFPWEDVLAALDAGIDAVGENYAQEILAKYGQIPAGRRPNLHFIGRLQSNKVAQLAPFISTWQTVDRKRLVDAIARHAPGARIMIQVNATGESGKGGCLPSEAADLVALGRSANLHVVGLMVVGPTSGDRVETRMAFETAARLRSDLSLPELSMGMSSDLDIAVEMGTTMIRVGSALFGGRPPKA